VPHPLGFITLLTDFGDRDWFVASMKGVILTINPHATIVDLSHQIAPYRIDEAGYFLKSCYREFPEGTIHVVVVDPGVGSGRQAIAVMGRRYFFLAPDNGVLTHIFEEEQPIEVREIDQRRFRRESPGHTFDGRDLFAPAAAWLARQQPFESFGRLINDPKAFTIAETKSEATALVGEIVHVDRFGNLISNITATHLGEFQNASKATSSTIRIGKCMISRLVTSYTEGQSNCLCALVNSNGFLELFIREDNAANSVQLGVGDRIYIE
jgi:S-adenosylmethionine hydrolase